MNSRFKIFKAEKDAGLADKIRANSSVAYITKVEPLDPTTAFAQRLIKVVASTEHPSETLYPMKDILVTTGWNINTDVFDNGETWSARNTPVHHPLNFMHDEKRIIGNITASQAVDDSMAVIDENLAIDELPNKYHILNGSVIYRAWVDPAQQALIDKTISEIEAGKWYVSMECIFKGFDYGVIRSDGSSAVIPRDETSAFLTKHLRQYGGDGIYRCGTTGQEFRLGRVLRNISFIGKGLVQEPANPESVILNNVSSFATSFANLGYIKVEAEVNSTTEKTTESNDMAETNADIQKLEERVDKLVKENESLQLKLKDRDGEAAKAEIDGLKTEVTGKDKEIATLKTSNEELTNTIKSLNTQITELTSSKQQVEEQLSKLQAEKVEQTRLSVLASKGATVEKAAELVKKFANFSDEQFNEMAETLSAAWKKPGNDTTQTKKPEDVIDKAKVEKDAALAATTQSNEDRDAERRAKASKYISGFLRHSRLVESGETK